ncbi:MAG: ribosomal-processing cysteine protease Prp [Clostridiales bacterium]|jgi:uncharacterized protein YsxB (DUF464 family)|nr:ribosomal-processing cysteine protease Prp [Ruminococcus sp.]MCR5264264.1 ribosomal-processing cysteine protease Prp [Clostridiales bacterium]
MTKVTFLKRGGVYYGFHETGHTGWGESGDDVLCAALSAMTMLIINVIEVSYGSSVEYTIDEKTTDITVKAYGALSDPDDRKRYAISGLIEGYFLQLNDMLEDYYDYLDVGEESEDANVRSDSLDRK